MKILIAHSFYRILGGENRYVEQQSELLRERHDVELFVRRNERLRASVGTAARMTYSRAEVAEVDEVVTRFRPDVIHLHNAYPSLGPAVHIAARRHRVPLVLTVHNSRLRCPNGYMFTEGAVCRRCESGVYAHAVVHRCFPTRQQGAGYAVALWIHRFVLRLEDAVDLFVCPSAFMRDRLLAWGIADERISVVPNFTAAPPSPPGLGTYGAFVGRLSSEKGVDVLLRALREAGDPPFRIVGDGHLRAGLEGLATQLGLRNTAFLNRLEPADVAAVVRGARFVALPSLCDENAPLSALEAMAAARHLLVSARGGLPELVASGGGLTCRSGDVRDLAARIVELVRDDDLCRRLGEASQAAVRARYAPDPHARMLEEAYRLAAR